MKETEYNEIEFNILKEIDTLLKSSKNNSNFKKITSLRSKLRKLRLENLDKSNIYKVNNEDYFSR